MRQVEARLAQQDTSQETQDAQKQILAELAKLLEQARQQQAQKKPGGSGKGFEAGLERAAPALAEVLELCNDRTWLLVENSAGTGDTIGRSVEELAAIFDRLDGHPRLGLCLDSCHLWVSGVDVTDA